MRWREPLGLRATLRAPITRAQWFCETQSPRQRFARTPVARCPLAREVSFGADHRCGDVRDFYLYETCCARAFADLLEDLFCFPVMSTVCPLFPPGSLHYSPCSPPFRPQPQ